MSSTTRASTQRPRTRTEDGWVCAALKTPESELELFCLWGMSLSWVRGTICDQSREKSLLSDKDPQVRREGADPQLFWSFLIISNDHDQMEFVLNHLASKWTSWCDSSLSCFFLGQEKHLMQKLLNQTSTKPRGGTDQEPIKSAS